MDVLSKFGSNEEVEIQLEFLTVSDESEELGVGLFLREGIALGPDSLEFGNYTFKIVAQV